MTDARDPQSDRELLLVAVEQLNRIDGKLFGEYGMCKQLDNHEKRIRFIENRYQYILGGIGVIVFLVSLGRYFDFTGP